jgi:ATP-dependent DNA helicase DinG
LQSTLTENSSLSGVDAGEPGASPAPAHDAAQAPVESNGKYDAEVERIFGAGGPLAPAVGTFRPRQSQTEMAKAIAHAIGSQGTLIAEAGTGTG